MKHRWLTVLLIISLALNAGALGAFAWHRYQRWSSQRRFYGELQQGTRARISSVIDEHRCEMDSLRQEHFRTRRLLALLGDAERPEPAELDSLLDRLSDIHREMNRLAFSTSREVFRMLPEQRREVLRERWRKMHTGLHRHRPDQPRFRQPPGGPPPEMEDF